MLNTNGKDLWLEEIGREWKKKKKNRETMVNEAVDAITYTAMRGKLSAFLLIKEVSALLYILSMIR